MNNYIEQLVNEEKPNKIQKVLNAEKILSNKFKHLELRNDGDILYVIMQSMEVFLNQKRLQVKSNLGRFSNLKDLKAFNLQMMELEQNWYLIEKELNKINEK